LPRPRRSDPPAEVVKITTEIRRFLQTEDPAGRRIGTARCGVYAFYDYDGEPMYVGQTVESLNTRIGRHLTARRPRRPRCRASGARTCARLPGWEQGEDGLLAVLGIEGRCCSSCAQDSAFGQWLPEVELPDGRTVEVCCQHAQEIKDALAGREKADRGPTS